jgi:hypothetical protein
MSGCASMQIVSYASSSLLVHIPKASDVVVNDSPSQSRPSAWLSIRRVLSATMLSAGALAAVAGLGIHRHLSG